MGRKESNYGHSNIDKYRKQLGKQEFKGRNKKHTLQTKNKAQYKDSFGRYFQMLILYVLLILVIMLGIYAFFYFMIDKLPPPKE